MKYGRGQTRRTRSLLLLPRSVRCPGELLYSGLSTEHVDSSAGLQPFSVYDYRVTAVNSLGQTSSTWASVRTAQAAPDYVPPPTLLVRILHASTP